MKILSTVLLLFVFIGSCGRNSDIPEEFNREDYKIEAEEMPTPVGGIKAILEKIIYPEKAKDEKIEGTVLVKTFINENGYVVWTEIFKSDNPVFDSSALNSIKKVKFISGKQNGENVKVQVVIPVTFKLE